MPREPRAACASTNSGTKHSAALLQMLETHQKGIHDALTGMEGEAERLYREERPLLDDDSR